MKTLAGLLMTAAFTVAGTSGAAAGPTVAELRAAIDTAQQTDHGLTKGMCVGAYDRGTTAIKCYGKAGPGKGKPDPDTLWSLGSITKTFTTTLLALRTTTPHASIHLNSKVRHFITPPDGKVNIPASLTLQDLVQHYAGFPHTLPASLWDTISDEHDMNRRLSECFTPAAEDACTLVAPPGTQGHYSNLGFDWAGNIVARHDGFAWNGDVTPWEHDVTKNVLAPLGMHHTHGQDAWNTPARVAWWSAHSANGAFQVGSTFTWQDDEFLPGGLFDAPGGGGRETWSSSRDMMKWLKFNLGELPSASAPLKHTLVPTWQDPSRWRPEWTNGPPPATNPPAAPDVTRDYALAWAIRLRHGPGQPLIVDKGGATNAFRTIIAFDGDKRDRGVFVLTNTRRHLANGDFDLTGPDVPYDVGCALMRLLPPANPGLHCPAES